MGGVSVTGMCVLFCLHEGSVLDQGEVKEVVREGVEVDETACEEVTDGPPPAARP